MTLLDRARKEVGERRNEKPLGKTSLYEAVGKLRDNRDIDRVLAVAPLPPGGNAIERFIPGWKKPFQAAVRAAWCDKRGTWLTVKAQLEALC
ncbi:Hypothetical protein RG1141_PA08660 (plasmid) [Neorhizobium galegae bv. officinalis bv. officinalis str. HAMBI 1141]|uniref:Uncharacterized protein n=1 Tax=Neorhizobium galegae bv. officinalis bv. officinalis str. HAMBI 1141 TaxID=1028801 RepID=A0A068TH36_NEOGA|nr:MULTISPECIES: hypothetical protein [Neorhizobium]MCJ9674245.1 hypothetical protein [Neorhizobium sp. SHOUNA12B]MCJ9748940.1 hypothetical protein [Neorhizobium sp. SHOUNA12A]CDN57698.1 Hypothetical protein RG1141_PA08660 [Neorhizobium galegae bv. officinalis bv. officinalis str. HAMBI 1141]